MKKIFFSLLFICATVHAHNDEIDTIAAKFNQLSEEQQIKTFINFDPFACWINQEFPEYAKKENADKYRIIAQKIGLKKLIPKVQEYCLERIPFALRNYIKDCKNRNVRACSFSLNEKTEELIFNGDKNLKEMAEEYLTPDQVLYFVVATAIHNDKRELETLFN